MLSEFLTDTFPGLDDATALTECWIVNAIRSEHPELNVFSEALEAVSRYGRSKVPSNQGQQGASAGPRSRPPT